MPVLNVEALEARIAAEDPVAVLFYADWCGFCHRFMAPFRTWAGDQQGRVVAADLSSYGDPRWERFEISVVPTIIVFQAGNTRQRADGRLGRGLNPGDLEAVGAALGP